MAPARRLRPITREALKRFYQSYPLDPVPVEENEMHMDRMKELIASVQISESCTPSKVFLETPTRIDDIFWRNRCAMAEF